MVVFRLTHCPAVSVRLQHEMRGIIYYWAAFSIRKVLTLLTLLSFCSSALRNKEAPLTYDCMNKVHFTNFKASGGSKTSSLLRFRENLRYYKFETDVLCQCCSLFEITTYFESNNLVTSFYVLGSDYNKLPMEIPVCVQRIEGRQGLWSNYTSSAHNEKTLSLEFSSVITPS